MQMELGKVETSEWYIDKAFNRGKKRIQQTKIKTQMKREEKYKYLEGIRISVINDTLRNDLKKLVNIFPRFEELDTFYKQVFECMVDIDKYKHSLGKLTWAQQQIQKIFKENYRTLQRKTNSEEVLAVRNTYLARTSSVFKQISKAFAELEDARKKIKDMPNVKTSLFTIAIAGFPNVGKSTLLGKLTDSKPEVNSYAFTTKGLMIGYLGKGSDRIQIIDTPGTLNRFDKMNKIEKIAHLCMKYCAYALVYVFDFTEPYDITEQVKLYQDLKKLNKKIIVYFSKSDIIDTKLIDGFDVKGLYNIEELKQQLVSLAFEASQL
ncbi:50S ribosome-binding GTPase [Candidatus Woesearchaeota archaeon]|nr:50S ribosome-binding GTPase [Candidatus Woesearchaeota archaeon]